MNQRPPLRSSTNISSMNQDYKPLSFISETSTSQDSEESYTEKNAQETTPLLQISIIRENSDTTLTPIFKYVGIRMMPLAVEVDSATIQMLYYDFLHNIKYISYDHIIASTTQGAMLWSYKNNRQLLNPATCLQLVHMSKIQENIQFTKMYFRHLIVHPIKLVITFVQTPFLRNMNTPSSVTSSSSSSSSSNIHHEKQNSQIRSYNYEHQSLTMNILTSLVGLDRMKIRLKSFEVEDALESKSSLMNSVLSKLKSDLQSQIGSMAGSLAVFGSPMGFASKVGRGVRAFFYEPYQGLVHSPQEFVLG